MNRLLYGYAAPRSFNPQPPQSQIGNYGSQSGRSLGIDNALAMRNYLDTLKGTRPRRKEPTIPLLYLYGYS